MSVATLTPELGQIGRILHFQQPNPNVRLRVKLYDSISTPTFNNNWY